MEKINEIVMINIGDIIPNPFQPRKIFNDNSLLELSSSIGEYGILQPITVRKNNDKYEIIMGERRYRAAKLINLKTIPSIILDVTNNDSAAVALIENIQRENLSFIEEAQSYKLLLENHDFTQSDLSKKVGKSQSAISNKLRILKLDEKLLDMFSQSNLTERHARAFLKIKNKNLENKLINKVIENNLNVKDTETLIDNNIKKMKKNTQSSTFKINYKIYLNTIKKSFKMINEMCKESTMNTEEFDEYLEVTIKIPKK